MNQIKVGKFIAELRHREGMTQQQLGEKIGVTNKTISRWENGNYMPDIEMFQILGEVFRVSVNELLAGQMLTDEEFRKQADENVVAVSKESKFTFLEKKEFWIKKWRKEHIWIFVMMLLVDFFIVGILIGIGKSELIGFLPIIMAVEYVWQNNQMMIYVENHLYGIDKKNENRSDRAR